MLKSSHTSAYKWNARRACWKISKIPQTPDARRKHVQNSLQARWVRLVYVRRASLYVAKSLCAFRARLG